MVSDTVVVQFCSAGIVAAGLVCVFSSSALFPTKNGIREVSEKNPVPWSPRGLFGKGDGAKSPVFGIMWGSIFFTQFVFSVAIFVYAVLQRDVSDVQSMWNQCACVAGSLLMASVWTPLFSEERKWTFLVSSILLVSTAFVSTCGAILAQPFFTSEWYLIFGGVSTTILSGWSIVAAGISIGVVTKVYNHGLNVPERNDSQTSSLFPLVLSIITSILSILFANPVFPIPLLVTLIFIPKILSDWKIFVSAIVCIVGICVGVGMIFVFRETGYPF